jgi:hypothetical protein
MIEKEYVTEVASAAAGTAVLNALAPTFLTGLAGTLGAGAAIGLTGPIGLIPQRGRRQLSPRLFAFCFLPFGMRDFFSVALTGVL